MKKAIVIFLFAILMSVASFSQCTTGADLYCADGYTNINYESTYRFYVYPENYSMTSAGGFTILPLTKRTVIDVGGSLQTGVYWIDVEFDDPGTSYTVDFFYHSNPYCSRVDAPTKYVTTTCVYSPGQPSAPGSAPTAVPRTIYGDAVDGADSYEWSIAGGDYSVLGSSIGVNITIRFDDSWTNYTIKQRAVVSGCGASNWSLGESYSSLL